jgi:two-component system sensor histidine kinase KdpD
MPNPAVMTMRHKPWAAYGGAVGVSCACTVIAYPLYPHFSPVNIIMLYLLGTTAGALRLGRGPSILLAVTNVLAFDFFFVPPRFSFDVEDAEYLFTLGVMLVVALVVVQLVVSVGWHRDRANERERRTAVLYALSRELAAAADETAIAEVAVRHIGAVFDSTVTLLVAADDGGLAPLPAALHHLPPLHAHDPEVARDVATRGESHRTDALYVPLRSGRRIKDVMVVRPSAAEPAWPAEQLELLEAFATQLASSLQRARLAEAAEAARLSEEQALLRNTLLASISHDLRTPLSAIAGAGSLIAQLEYSLSSDRRTTLGSLIERKARDMSQLLSNILELTQMEFNSGTIRADWHAIDDLMSHSLRTNAARLAQHRILLDLAAELPLIRVDANLVVQILGNLLENVAKYTPTGSTVTLSAELREGGVLLAVADDGPGLPAGDPELLFEKFHRGRPEGNVAGVGLGLAICRAAARLHGGDIRASNRPAGGARFEVMLPVAVASQILPAEPEPLRIPA